MDQRENVLNHLPDTTNLRTEFESLLDRSTEVDLDRLVEEVDDSNYSLKDWAEAFLVFDKWLSHQAEPNVERNFTHILGYLHCCQMMISDSVENPNLQAIVIQCLTDYGYDPLKSTQS